MYYFDYYEGVMVAATLITVAVFLMIIGIIVQLHL